MNFPSNVFLMILIMVTEQLYRKKTLWLLQFFMTMATYCYYEKVHRIMRTTIAL